ncbi:hypothetical protein [Paenibacillus pseudetheri]|uniref:LPXTG cell wall anchor domain-containing protein n=1 Tax=Paenibacillus pseudetheri TaxID=2897682 RepID=A0ABM9B692_9BACL|nr:hypothetical protein [Paenibacillus pseudetheri]CAH1054026.1 hypothetical protein PAECIP111894_00171 [Paenibacillus pseudetheri]
MNWIADNKDWIFSGVGVMALGIIGFFVKRFLDKEKKQSGQSISSGNNSNNIQGGNDVNVTIGDMNVRR